MISFYKDKAKEVRNDHTRDKKRQTERKSPKNYYDKIEE
jgi:hypothetical protein